MQHKRSAMSLAWICADNVACVRSIFMRPRYAIAAAHFQAGPNGRPLTPNLQSSRNHRFMFVAMHQARGAEMETGIGHTTPRAGMIQKSQQAPVMQVL
jgi:hypothetical protein